MPIFELPFLALYYNKWNGLENNEVSKLFDQLDFDSVLALEPNQQIWRDEDGIYDHGKVYGFVRQAVVRTEIVDNNKIRLYTSRGSTTITRDKHCQVYLLNNPKKLAQMYVEDRRIGHLK